MSDYIKRSDAVKALRMIKNSVDIFLKSIDDAASAVDDLATKADVRENIHAHWIDKPLDKFRKFEIKCSACGWSGVENYDSYVDISDFEFCPYCGAIMDEEAEE